MIPERDPQQWRRPLKRGMTGHDVAGWQTLLEERGYVLAPFSADGTFGSLTEKRTIQFQLDRGLTPDGMLDADELVNLSAPAVTRPPVSTTTVDAQWPFLQAATWTWANRKVIGCIVVHSMEAKEKPDTAEAVAAWFAGLRGKPPEASAHACVDSDSLVRCVRPEHMAAAAPGANTLGYHIEHAGYAKQTTAEWLDAYSLAMLRISAAHTKKIATAYSIPLQWATEEQFVELCRQQVAKQPITPVGFLPHALVTRVWQSWAKYGLPKPKRAGDHVDPGPAFPWGDYMDLVRAA